MRRIFFLTFRGYRTIFLSAVSIRGAFARRSRWRETAGASGLVRSQTWGGFGSPSAATTGRCLGWLEWRPRCAGRNACVSKSRPPKGRGDFERSPPGLGSAVLEPYGKNAATGRCETTGSSKEEHHEDVAFRSALLPVLPRVRAERRCFGAACVHRHPPIGCAAIQRNPRICNTSRPAARPKRSLSTKR
jgi:hypothetical protein